MARKKDRPRFKVNSREWEKWEEREEEAFHERVAETLTRAGRRRRQPAAVRPDVHRHGAREAVAQGSTGGDVRGPLVRRHPLPRQARQGGDRLLLQGRAVDRRGAPGGEGLSAADVPGDAQRLGLQAGPDPARPRGQTRPRQPQPAGGQTPGHARPPDRHGLLVPLRVRHADATCMPPGRTCPSRTPTTCRRSSWSTSATYRTQPRCCRRCRCRARRRTSCSSG